MSRGCRPSEALMKSHFRLPSILIGLLFFLACGEDEKPMPFEEPSASEVLALVHGTLVDGTWADPIFDSALLIEEELIAAVGRYAEVEIPPGARIIDLQGATVLPGFINSHVHTGYNESNLRTWAQGGVTTVRDLGADPRRPLFVIRDSLLEDSSCARLVAAGPMVTVPGGYPMVPWSSPSGLPVTSPDDARQKTHQLLDNGADVIKIALECGTSFGRIIPSLSPAETEAIVEVAHSRGTRVSAHVLVSEDLERALDGGVDDIAHMVTDVLPDRLIDRMVKDDVYWVPTIELWKGVGHGLGEVAVGHLQRFVQAGGRVALGTDYAGYSSEFDLGMPIREIRWMHDAGMTPLQIIVAATRHAAYVSNLEDVLGTLEQGKIADVLVVNGDPIQDLGVLQDVRMVLHNGIIIRGD